MTDRNDGRPRHSASHIHCAVPFFCARSGTEGEAARRCGGGSRLSAGNASRSLRACVGAVWGSGSAREGRVAVRGRAKGCGGEWVVRSARKASRSLRACVGAAWGSGSVREGSEKVLGREQVFGEEWVVRSAGLTHFRRSSSRVRVLLYIRPPRHRREIKAMGTKDAPCEHPSPAKPSAPAPSAFIFPCRCSHFLRIPFGLPPNDFRTRPVRVCTSVPAFTLPPHTLWRRPRRLRPPAAVVIHNGLSTEKLSTSLLATLCKTFSPRACARVYIIYRSLVGRSRGVSAPLRKRVRAVVTPCPAPPCAGWGRARAKADAPSRSAPYLPAYGRAPAACVPNHCAQRRSAQGNPRPCPCVLPATACLRPRPCPLMGELSCAKVEVQQTNPAPARAFSPWQLVYCPAPPADGRSAERRVGEGEGKGGRPLAQQPAPVCLPPRPRRLNGSPATAGGRENDRMAHRRTATPTHRTPRGNDTCTIRVPRRKGAQSVVHNL